MPLHLNFARLLDSYSYEPLSLSERLPCSLPLIPQAMGYGLGARCCDGRWLVRAWWLTTRQTR